ncbi:MAG TPA: hypothetical protein PK765_04945 [bacterium]|nr:hypothetical protein [bacterium]
MKASFRDYFVETFFAADPSEFDRFSESLLARRPKTFRVNRLKTGIETFASRWRARGLPMGPTMNSWVFSAGHERVKL